MNNGTQFLKLMQKVLDELRASQEDELVSASLTKTLAQLCEAYDCYLTGSPYKTK